MIKEGAFKIPERLVEDIARDNCVLFVGAGLSMGARLPSWRHLMERMMDWAEEHRVDLSGDRRELKSLIKESEYLLVAEELRELMGKERFKQFMTEVFRDDRLRPTDTHRLLPEIQFSAVVTTNYDVLLEGVYTSPDGGVPRSYTQEDTGALSALHRDGKFYILKLHGDIDRIETIVLGRSDYREVMFANQAYRDFLTTLFGSKTVLFVGTSLTDFDLLLLLDEMRTAFKGYGSFHYALMPQQGAGRIRRKRFERDYGIQIITYLATEGHPEVRQFLEELRDEVRGVKDPEFGRAKRLFWAMLRNEAGEQPISERVRGFINDMFQRVEIPPSQVEAPEGMVYVPPGEFIMGEGQYLQIACLEEGFFIGKYPVTNREYKEFIDTTGHAVPFGDWDSARPYNWDSRKRTYPASRDDHPVVLVSWHDARDYCNWLREKTGKPYRLPTEAEWEKAARGVDGRTYPWGNEFDKDRCNTSESGIGITTRVGHYSPKGGSPYGACDMAGNIWEWCSSLIWDYPYNPDDGREDLEAEGRRVLRGGSWNIGQDYARCAYRLRYYPGSRDYDFGFRVAASPGSP